MMIRAQRSCEVSAVEVIAARLLLSHRVPKFPPENAHVSDSRWPLDAVRCILSFIHNGPLRRVLDLLLILGTDSRQAGNEVSLLLCPVLETHNSCVGSSHSNTEPLYHFFSPSNALKKPAPSPSPQPLAFFPARQTFWYLFGRPCPSYCYIVPQRTVNNPL